MSKKTQCLQHHSEKNQKRNVAENAVGTKAVDTSHPPRPAMASPLVSYLHCLIRSVIGQSIRSCFRRRMNENDTIVDQREERTLIAASNEIDFKRVARSCLCRLKHDVVSMIKNLDLFVSAGQPTAGALDPGSKTSQSKQETSKRMDDPRAKQEQCAVLSRQSKTTRSDR